MSMNANKIFCIGMSKTGTKSLNEALNVLGFNTLHWLPQKEVIEQLEVGDLHLKVLDDHAGVTDVIGIRWYKELDRLYPGSKFILSVREKEDWLASIANFWPKNDVHKRHPAFYYYRVSVFGSIDFRRDHYWDVYQDHVHNVRRYFADRPDDILEIDVCGGDRWEKLCQFLGVDTPPEAFPHLNKYRAKTNANGQEEGSPTPDPGKTMSNEVEHVTPKSTSTARLGVKDCVVLVPVGGSIEPGCERSLSELERRGYSVRRVRGYAAIDQARNRMASDALRDGYSETLWIDSDIEFDVEDVERLRGRNLPICSAIYVKKGKRSLACHVRAGTEMIEFGANGGLTEIQYAATGFLHVRREVYETMRDKLELPICNEKFGAPTFPFFQPLIIDEPKTGKWYLGEDFSFCERARRVGFTIYADTSIRLKHHGRYEYSWEDAGADPVRYKNYVFKLQ